MSVTLSVKGLKYLKLQYCSLKMYTFKTCVPLLGSFLGAHWLWKWFILVLSRSKQMHD